MEQGTRDSMISFSKEPELEAGISYNFEGCVALATKSGSHPKKTGFDCQGNNFSKSL
jgi:hypothetical protein